MKISKILLSLSAILIFLFIVFYILEKSFSIGIPFEQSAIIIISSYFISILVFIVFLRGALLGGKSWLTHTLGAISMKFMLYLFLIILVYFSSKNRSMEFILTFFVIYLSFTSYLLLSFLKILKTKNLNK